MNAPAEFPARLEPYRSIVVGFRPGCAGDELRRRAGILYLRDRANAGLRIACWEASFPLGAVQSLASQHAFASMSSDQLETLYVSLVRLMSIASSLEGHGPHQEVMHG